MNSFQVSSKSRGHNYDAVAVMAVTNPSDQTQFLETQRTKNKRPKAIITSQN
jgi:hypothetical protein